jgi:hypothetical protein
MNIEIRDLISMLIRTTESGELICKCNKTENKLQRTMIANSPDGTEFKMELKYLISPCGLVHSRPRMLMATSTISFTLN